MNKKEILVKIRVFLDELEDFFSEDASFGTLARPYPADAFFTFIAPQAYFSGPQRNIMKLDSGTTYKIRVEDSDGKPLKSSSSDSYLELSLIANDSSDKGWNKVIKDAPKPEKGKLKFKGDKDDHFRFSTTDELPKTVRMKYDIIFEFKTEKGGIKYGHIDPYTDQCTPPPKGS